MKCVICGKDWDIFGVDEEKSGSDYIELYEDVNDLFSCAVVCADKCLKIYEKDLTNIENCDRMY